MNGKPQDPSTTLRIARLVAATATTLAAILFSAALPAAAGVQEVDDSAGIRARVEQYRTAWNTHDPSALAAFFTEDADFVMGNLPAVHGRRAIRDWWQDYFARQEPERRLTLDVSPVKLIAEDVAVVNVATTTGGHGPEGQELRRRRFRGTWLLQRRGGDWLISAMRGFPQEDDRVVLNASVEAAETLRPQIRAFVAAYEDAWNSHDPSAVSGLYRDDADIMIRNAPLVHGREAIQNWWSTYFSQPRPYRAIFIIDEIRMITPGVALINLTATGAAVSQAGDQRLPVRSARGTWVIVRDAGEWLLSEMWVLPSEDDSIVRSSGGPN
jgi:uncharacterized protein (TIGR02246 family)